MELIIVVILTALVWYAMYVSIERNPMIVVQRRRDNLVTPIRSALGGGCYMIHSGKKVGKTCDEYYNSDNELHREGGPARIVYFDNGDVADEYYYKNGLQHRDDGPAVIAYHPNGNVHYERYYRRDQQHCVGGPAVTEYYNDGTVNFKRYYIYGCRVGQAVPVRHYLKSVRAKPV